MSSMGRVRVCMRQGRVCCGVCYVCMSDDMLREVRIREDVNCV